MPVRALLPNPPNADGDRLLTPGLFARVHLPIGGPHPALLISDRAIGIDQGQKYVLLVNDKNVVETVQVAAKDMHDGLREVKGLKPGQNIIVVGLQHVRPGAEVETKPTQMPLPIGATLPSISIAAQPKSPAAGAAPSTAAPAETASDKN
jgi:multidrug efflux system membrane fusion protein